MTDATLVSSDSATKVRDYVQKNMSFSDQYRFGESMLNRALNNKLPGQ